MTNLSDLKIAVANESTVKGGTIVLLNNLANHVVAVAGDKAATEELGRAIGAYAEEMSNAMTANTPPESTVREQAPQTDGHGLRTDGPTLAEYLEAGYKPGGYPPSGFTKKPSPDDDAVLAAWNEAHPQTAVPAAAGEFGMLSFRTGGEPNAPQYFLLAPWPSKVRAPAESLKSPVVKVDGDFVTFYAENGRATYKAEDIKADPVVLDLQPDSTSYKEPPAA